MFSLKLNIISHLFWKGLKNPFYKLLKYEIIFKLRTQKENAENSPGLRSHGPQLQAKSNVIQISSVIKRFVET